MALNSTLQDQWGSGIFRTRRAPGYALYDAVNLLVADDGLLYKRGGDAYYSGSDAGTTITRLGSYKFAGPDVDRVLMWGERIYVLNGTTPLEIFDSVGGLGGAFTFGRPASASGTLTFPASPLVSTLKFNRFIYYGGSLLPSGGSSNQGTITVTNGSRAVTKSGGTTWVGNIDPGMFLNIVGAPYGIVRSVDSANALTLVSGWGGTTASTTSYDITPTLLAGMALDGIPTTTNLKMASAGQRLLATVGNRVYESTRGFPFGFDPDIYQELGTATESTGIEGIGDTSLVFTTSGTWAIDNLSLDPVDDFGNQQQDVRHVSGEVILWGDLGITPWGAGQLLVPALDDVFAMNAQGTATPITGTSENERVRRLYRSYVATDGYQPGIGRVHAGHLFLPILNGTDVADVLVCRLDREQAWTRWAGHAASPAFAVLPGSDSVAPKLLGLAGQRVTDLTGCFDPTGSNTTDADGTIPTVQITTRDYPTGQQPGFVTKIRGRYELVADGIPYSLDRADQNLDGGDWRKDPFNQLDGPVTITGNQYAGGAGENGYSSWLTTKSFTAPLAVKSIIQARPATNLDAATFTALGLVQGPVISDDPFADHNPDGGYETRVRFESAHDTVTIERYDTNNRTRIAGPTNLGSRILPGDTFLLTVAADGTISALVNDVVIASVTDTTYFHAGESANLVVRIVDQSTGGLQSAIRLDSSAVGVAVEYSSDADGGTWHDLTETGEQNGGTGWTISDGSLYQFAKVGKKRERIRFRFTLASACASFVWRSLEMLTRPSGKQ